MPARLCRSRSLLKQAAAPALCALAAAVFAQSAIAGGPLGAGARGGVGAQIGAGANVPPVGVGAGAAAGVSAGVNARADVPVPSARALENANGQFIEDRKFGLDRAQERLSEEGAEHQKATEAVKKKAARRAGGAAGASSESSAQSSASTSTGTARQ